MLLITCIFATALSSFLLFVIQPLAAKTLLPIFGGVPAVWNICLLFFQGMLLLGYAYAHVIAKFFKLKTQWVMHFLMIMISVSMLPIVFKQLHVNQLTPALNVLYLLARDLFFPLFIVSSTAPLIQLWYSRTPHLHAEDPYFLYSASNVGSLLALMMFPFLLEPFFGVHNLTQYWSALYAVFLGMLGLAAWQCRVVAAPSIKENMKSAVTWQQRCSWLLLSFAPSSLLMAVTQYITTEIVATPLLWILPLTIYLLCFIITFAAKPIISHQWMVREQSLFLIFPLISLSKVTLTLPAWQLILFHLSGFFALVMVCLGELVKKRPDKTALTDFYLWIGIGGFLGGCFNALIAPLIFNNIYEYYVAFCLCLALRPWPKSWHWQHRGWLLSLGIALVLSINYFIFVVHDSLFLQHFPFLKWLDLFIVIAVITVIMVYDKQPMRYAVNVAILFFFAQGLPGFGHHDLLWQDRNFFGVTRVYKNDATHLHMLMNGSTLHGLEVVNKPMQFNRLTSYYQPLALVATLKGQEKNSLQVAIAGLGTGALSCQFRPHDQVSFFEIDPQVIHIANNPQFFTYLTKCPPKKIMLGDARIQLNSSHEQYDEIIIDVFSSDAIPLHLFTREAVQAYLNKLSPDGVLVFNISNRHVNLAPVLIGIGQQLKMNVLQLQSAPAADLFQLASDWVILTNNQKIIAQLTQHSWKKVTSDSNVSVWTDDFSNIVRYLK